MEPQKATTIDMEFLFTHLKKRVRTTNKGTFGKVVVLAGCRGMAGAAMLAGMGALKSGVGLLLIACPEEIESVIQTALWEAMTVSAPTKMALLDKIEERMDKVKAIAVGPGIGRNRENEDMVERLVRTSQVPLVIDADALHCLINPEKQLKAAKAPLVLTPHPGEMAYITGLTIPQIQGDREGITRYYAEKWGVTILLKGSHSVIAAPNGETVINTNGNPGMATGGSGDVLSGIIASFIAQGMDIFPAAAVGAYIHGRAGDLAAQELGEYGMTAKDILTYLPLAIKEFVRR